MSDSMFHRVKVAIRRADRDGIDAQARAAIEAMREPTHEMGEAARRLPEWRHISIWQAMIDAALSEKP